MKCYQNKLTLIKDTGWDSMTLQIHKLDVVVAVAVAVVLLLLLKSLQPPIPQIGFQDEFCKKARHPIWTKGARSATP